MVVNVIFDSTPEYLDYSLLEESKRKIGQSGAVPGFQQLLQRNKQPQNLVIPSVWMWTHRAANQDTGVHVNTVVVFPKKV